MKASSSIHGKAAVAASAVAVSAALAIGMVGCTPSSNSGATSTASNANSASSSQAAPSSPSDVNPANVKITEEEALKSALSYADLKKSQIQLVKSELDTDHGTTVYEIEFIGPDNMEYDVEVDASNGTVFSFESELAD